MGKISLIGKKSISSKASCFSIKGLGRVMVVPVVRVVAVVVLAMTLVIVVPWSGSLAGLFLLPLVLKEKDNENKLSLSLSGSFTSCRHLKAIFRARSLRTYSHIRYSVR